VNGFARTPPLPGMEGRGRRSIRGAGCVSTIRQH
jgi:hypothetical protein